MRPVAPRQHQTRLTPAEIAALITDYQSGLTVAATARKYNINVKTATKHLVDHNIPIRQTTVHLPASELPALLELRTAGWNISQIARHYGCSRQAVQQALKRAEQIKR